ncbi:MAG: 4-(cytidine 5'-diphospho)-2-C-methyl-D-erythritol kinase [Anaerovoracaceae bacterium]|nr:4-(cytidine 5'-diphospho)-2-C-methyl-D-erythritol kinase [Anaerovoracaceae bacterium]
MNVIRLKAFAKINLTLDVLGVLDNGYHELSMIMQQILLCDEVQVKWLDSSEAGSGISVQLSTNKRFLPTDERNLAYKAALLMAESFGENKSGTIRIDIKKRIPVAAGLAGGSSNGAAVLHAINMLWQLGLDVAALCDIGKTLGSDVPFCIMGQAAANDALRDVFTGDPMACHCALATGTGTELRPITGLRSHLVLSKPGIGVSTAEVYRGIDDMTIPAHPDNDAMISALNEHNFKNIKKNLINVLENFTLNRYPIVMYTKDRIQQLCSTGCVLMSGSGPTVFGLCRNVSEAKTICRQMTELNKESFWTRTTW